MRNNGKVTSEPALLELNRATVVRGGIAVLDNLSLRVPVGCHTVILGPNGSGKSTLVRLLTRELYALYRDDGPPVRIMGKDRWDVVELRSMLGLVTSDLQGALTTVEGQTVEEAVVSGFFASNGIYRHHRVSAAMRKAARDALARLDASHLGDRDLARLSTGEARRVVIARALVHNPKALLLDEPTHGLDLPARHRLLQGIGRLAATGTTLLLVTHHLEEIVPEIERVVLLKAGQVLADGSKREILTSAHLTEAFGAPIRVRRRENWYTGEME
jgi:iron complex transport system ATP-binding protein